jgi:hypothetical protein
MKRLLLTLLATIGLSATSFAADSDLYRYHLTSDHWTLGIFDEKDRFEMQKYCRAEDEDGIQKMLDEGRAILLRPGVEIYLMHLDSDKGLAGVQRTETSRTIWVPIDSLKK